MEDGGAVLKRGVEVEAEFGAVFGDATPAAFGEGEAFDGDADGRVSRGVLSEGAVYDLHEI